MPLRRSLASLGETTNKVSGVKVSDKWGGSPGALWRLIHAGGWVSGMVSRKSSSSIFSEEQKAAAYRPPGERGGSQGQRTPGLMRLGTSLRRPDCEEPGLKQNAKSIKSHPTPQ